MSSMMMTGEERRGEEMNGKGGIAVPACEVR